MDYPFRILHRTHNHRSMCRNVILSLCSLPQNTGRLVLTLSGHLAEQLVGQLLREDQRLTEGERAVITHLTEELQPGAHQSHAQIGQRRRRSLVLQQQHQIRHTLMISTLIRLSFPRFEKFSFITLPRKWILWCIILYVMTKGKQWFLFSLAAEWKTSLLTG